jgi:hypothetical protein
MKVTSIQIGRSYEITFGKSLSKVKVKNFDPKHGSWICETESGKSMSIKDPKRFLKEIKPKEPKQETATDSIKDDKIKNGKMKIPPKKKSANLPSKPIQQPVPKADIAQQLLAAMHAVVTRANIAKRACDYGFCSEKIVKEAEQEAETARADVRAAGITERKGGHTIGAMSGLDAAYKVLQEERRPMHAKEITQLAQERGYCELRGRTPDATIAAAIEIEMKRKGNDSRFTKADKGLFTIVES